MRWVWWSAADVAALVTAGWRPQACWDLAAVARLLDGGGRSDRGALWAAHEGRPVPAPPTVEAEPDLFAQTAPAEPPQLWAQRALALHAAQLAALEALPDHRAVPTSTPLPVLTGYAESAAAVLAVELGRDGLPVDLDAMSELLRPVIGDPPADARSAAAARRARDDAVRRLFPGGDDDGPEVDLRNPAHVRRLLARVGLDLPDTRSWRLEPHAATSPAVAALLAWRKADRLATTYGWTWLDRHVRGGRLRGAWTAAEGAGRMTATAGLHSLPAELRAGVRAEAGSTFVRADLGQVEPRVLAVVSGDPNLAAAARQPDLYAPVAAALRCDRPTAKVAVLAAMYGQTSGPAGTALQEMDRAYPAAMAYLRAAEDAGRAGRNLRTYGGRLLRLERAAGDDRHPPSAWGRFARNAVVQGAAAELFKAWAATVRAGLADLGLAARGGQIVLCLHDELLLHVPSDAREAAVRLVSEALDRTAHWWAAGSGVRFVADVGVGQTWAAAHDAG